MNQNENNKPKCGIKLPIVLKFYVTYFSSCLHLKTSTNLDY